MKKMNVKLKRGGMIFLLFVFCLVQAGAADCGDVNSDGIIDIIDGLLIAQYYVDLNPSNFDTTVADVNGDGSIDIVDALLVAQYYVGLIAEFPGCPGPTASPAPPEKYTLQAEEASWDNAVVESTHSGFTGSGYVNTDNASGVWIEWTVTISAEDDAACGITYACASGDRPMDLSVNGSNAGRLDFPATGAWDTWETQSANVNLTAGSNVIRLTAVSDEGAPNIDKLELELNVTVTTPTPTATPAPTTPAPTMPPGSGGIFSDTPVGFASLNGGTSGGAGGQVVTVTNQSDLERYAGASEPYIIKVQGTITLSPLGKEVNVTSNKTIVGVGSDATIKEGGFRIINHQNVIIRNLTIRDSFVNSDPGGDNNDNDGLQTDGATNIWINHIHFAHCGDGLMDIRRNTSYFTVSWCIFSDNKRGPTFGWTDNTEFKVTMHHNWIRNTVMRNPVFDQGIGHFYNNYSTDVSKYGHQSRGNARMVVENSYWDNVNHPYEATDSSELVVRGSIIINSSGRQEARGSAFDPSSYYSYTLDPTEDVPDLMRTYAGPSDQIQY